MKFNLEIIFEWFLVGSKKFWTSREIVFGDSLKVVLMGKHRNVEK